MGKSIKLIIGGLILIPVLYVLFWVGGLLAPSFFHQLQGLRTPSVVLLDPNVSKLERVNSSAPSRDDSSAFQLRTSRRDYDGILQPGNKINLTEASQLQGKVFVVRIPGTKQILIVPTRQQGTMLRAFLATNELLILKEFELIGWQSRVGPDRVFMPTKDILVVDGWSEKKDGWGFESQKLYQFDLRTGKLTATFGDVLANCAVKSFNENTGLIVYATENEAVGFGIVMPLHSLIRFYSPDYPEGIDVIRVNFFNGGIIRGGFLKGLNTIYFTTTGPGDQYNMDYQGPYRHWKVTLNSKGLSSD